ncbi:MAG: hypothetical protein J7539_18780, partial [Niabella sp.]|nr:hypothetical protein [Niabella sp.]
INPINGFDNMADLQKLEQSLKEYLPKADQYLLLDSKRKALDYDGGGHVIQSSLDGVIEKFLYTSGLKFISRYLRNWN